MLKLSKFNVFEQPIREVLNSAIARGKLKLNLKTPLLQFVLLLVAETAPGLGSIGKSEFPPHPAQTD